MQPQQVRHIRIRMGALTLDYSAPSSQADDVARMLTASHPGPRVSVTVDDDVHEDFPRLPCAGLWA
ncbi:hypothetical protein [Nocardia arizonensis]|uniref:hypothetical protein n=1 Tax=Nocardia arizonensis TaxID=1141647 RepID=UPI0006D22787|nr:hypothetical protein [Nocardia arizonensis]